MYDKLQMGNFMRKKKPPRSRLDMRVPDALLEKIRGIGEKEGIGTVSTIAIMLLTKAVAQYEQSAN